MAHAVRPLTHYVWTSRSDFRLTLRAPKLSENSHEKSRDRRRFLEPLAFRLRELVLGHDSQRRGGADRWEFVGTPVDTDNDGVADDVSTFGTVLDAIGVPDSVDAEAFVYGSQLGGDDFAFTGDEPGLVFRDGTTGAWYAANDPVGDDAFNIGSVPVPLTSFDQPAEQPTFGSINPSLIELSITP